MTQLAALLLHLGEDVDEVARLRLKNTRLRDGELSVRNANALPYGLGETVKATHKGARSFGEAVSDQGGEAAYLRGVEIIGAHEDLNGLQSSLAFEAECLANLLLLFEGQLVLVLAR